MLNSRLPFHGRLSVASISESQISAPRHVLLVQAARLSTSSFFKTNNNLYLQSQTVCINNPQFLNDNSTTFFNMNPLMGDKNDILLNNHDELTRHVRQWEYKVPFLVPMTS